jgi:hypothetical protein
LTLSVAALGSSRKNLRPLLPHELFLRFKVRIRIHTRYEIAISLQETCCKYAGAQVRPQPFSYRHISQIGFFKNLSAHSGVLGKKALQLDHETSFFVQDFEDLVSRGSHPVKVVRDDVGRAHGYTRRSFRTGPLRCSLLGLLL